MSMKLIDMRNNIFNMMRYDKDEILYLYNKTVDRVSEFSIKELDENKDLAIFREGIGSEDHVAFNIIKIMNFNLKLQRPELELNERKVYVEARERFLENKQKDLEKQRDEIMANMIDPQTINPDLTTIQSELMNIQFELKDNRLFYYNDTPDMVSSSMSEWDIKEEIDKNGFSNEALRKAIGISLNNAAIQSNRAGANSMNSLVNNIMDSAKKSLDKEPEESNTFINDSVIDDVINKVTKLMDRKTPISDDELLDLVFNRVKDISRIRGMGMVDAFIKHYIDDNKLVDKIKARLKSFNPKLAPEKSEDNLEFFNKFIKDHIDPADFVKILNKYLTDEKSEISKEVTNGESESNHNV